MRNKCKTCANRFVAPQWCKGCEYGFPGQDQYDFYQQIKHTVVMMKSDGSKQEKYDSVVSCNSKDGILTLFCTDGTMPIYPDDGSWMLIDTTPTCGWVENPAVVPKGNPNLRQIKVNLVRQIPSEKTTYVNDVYLTVDAAKFDINGKRYWEDPSIVVDELRRAAQWWLQTEEGWKANVSSMLDFNWGDLVDALPIEANCISLSLENNEALGINAEVAIAVDQDELLAPMGVPVRLLRKDGSMFGIGNVDFRNGVVFNVTSDQIMPKTDQPITVWVEETSAALKAHWYDSQMRYFLDKKNK